MKTDNFIKIAIFLGAAGIILGALGTHYLSAHTSVEKLSSFQTGIRYQIYHAILMLIITLNIDRFNDRIYQSLILICVGTFCFSFSIYFLSLEEIIGVKLHFLGPITPIGGTLLILAWINLLFTIKKTD